MTTNNNQVANNNIEFTTEEILNILADSHYLYSDDEASDGADLSATDDWNQYNNNDDDWDDILGVLVKWDITNNVNFEFNVNNIEFNIDDNMEIIVDNVPLPYLDEEHFALRAQALRDEIKLKFHSIKSNLHN